MPSPIVMRGTYDYRLVAVSVALAFFSAYAALELAERVTTSRGRPRTAWLVAGSAAMGLGIWSMHYIGMLALKTHANVLYHVPTVLLSLLAAILASATALFTVSRERMGTKSVFLASLFMGTGIASMHYIGMSAMRMAAIRIYDPKLVVLSVVLAILISLVALLLTFRGRRDTSITSLNKIGSAVLMGCAIPVMHYTGMEATSFQMTESVFDTSRSIAISSLGVTAISLTATFCLCAVLLAAFLSRSQSREMNIALARVGILMLMIMSLYETIDTLIIASWQSHVMEIFIATAAVMIGVYRFLRQREKLHEAMLQEVAFRKAAQAELEHANKAAELSNDALRNEITERCHTEERLRSSERRFLAATKATHQSIWEWDIKTDKIWTYAAENQFGLKREQSTTLDWFFGVVHPEDLDRVRSSLNDSVKGTGDNWSEEYRVRRGNGSYAFVLDRGVIDRDANGQALRMIGAMADVTQDKLLEQELRDAKERAEAANRENKLRLEQTPLPMWIYDLQNLTFIDVNEAALTHYGYSRHEVMNMTLSDLGPEVDLVHFMERVAEVSRELGATSRSISRHKTKCGTLIDVEIFGRTIYWHGRPAEIVFVNDISEQTRTTAYLNVAKEKAESANIAKSEFLANMSHEIRTPLNGIIGMTDLALETEMTPEQRDYLETVKISADSLLVVINDVLDFSKIESGKFELEQIHFDLGACLEETLKTLALRADEKGLELLCEIAADVPEFVVGDQSRLRQVVNNLVGNAIKFTSDGEVALKVQMPPAGNDRSKLHFVVSDTGIGIPIDKQETIFDPFTQADSSTTRKYGGTGLGLTISNRIVGLMNGTMWVESKVGQGSQFHFTAEMKAANAQPVQLGTIASPEILKNVKVLVVDDNRTNRRILEGLLKRWEMIPICVASGQEALTQLTAATGSSQPFGLILTDMHMPEMDGFNLIERIRAQHLSTAIIMMLTSAGHRGDASRCEELGISAYLLKPIRQSELREGIAKALGASESSGRIPLITRFSLSDARDPAHLLGVLLAEDNVVNQRLATRLLEKRGHRVTLAGNGREALRILETNSFDLIFMDLQMPEMDGMETTATIRETEKVTGRHQHIIALTAHAMAGDRERCIAGGMDGYLSKPIRPLEMDEVLENYIKLRATLVATTEHFAASFAPLLS